MNRWGPLEIISVPHEIVNGVPTVLGTFGANINYPFILFWVAMVGNLILFILALRRSKTTLD